MKKGTIIGLSIAGIIILLLVILISWGISTYNNLVTINEEVNQSWSQVENQYQRRADLIPNLVNTVKGYADFERGVLTDVTEARAKVSQFNITPEVLNDPQAFQKFEQLQGNLSSALSRLLVTVENYPNLKANENFLQLQAQLEGTENRISVERRKFNLTVQNYNTTIKRFPSAFFAGIFGFREKSYFKSIPGSEAPPKVEF
ncbi:MAG: LemA family protein [Ignavibacteria bacterium RIFOXYB2_FULL_35_12]|nr:MAG: LemA family protein [Ignavibacteria bacterium GWA2_36_19]OGU62971.1 MAG: LemA family protein [Ignavibacteria bacterium GWF2_35_20]OGU79463.1 MAG: LemA family protein [Ignavibacteria bacterium RIFOXYA2_FULL_35_9]OGU86578.1 MAG: LemA family protein [Ignavibacteria bacterium RIFOXYC12_FULL_35_11]OGU89040.1 MAG: LemA family protein [Ignavibacteria bacterium RIFOXYA12_FULL_35_25]OGU93331.1 MAG: LemA family protein [Ignavibacteria bacterium RIFOXYB12_FULL_35_14]OGV00097.1 MAG: LemA family p